MVARSIFQERISARQARLVARALKARGYKRSLSYAKIQELGTAEAVAAYLEPADQQRQLEVADWVCQAAELKPPG